MQSKDEQYTTNETLAADVAKLTARLARSERRSRMLTGGALALALAAFMPVIPAGAARQDVSLASIIARIAADEARIGNVEQKTATLTNVTNAQGGAINTLTTGLTATNGNLGTLRDFTHALRTLTPMEANVVDKFSLSNGVGTQTELNLTGVNLHLVNGLGATNGLPNNPSNTNPAQTHVNGLGNLIVGYDDVFQPDTIDPSTLRTGSHNIVLGSYNGYSSFGGLIGGQYNASTAPCASVFAGTSNVASGYASSVTGGRRNVSSGYASSVSGGKYALSSASYSSVSGGYHSTASGYASSVTGGDYNTATNDESSVLGGYQNTASGYGSAILGGSYNTATSDRSVVVSGDYNTASGSGSAALGGNHNTAAGNDSVLLGGQSNSIVINNGIAPSGSSF